MDAASAVSGGGILLVCFSALLAAVSSRLGRQSAELRAVRKLDKLSDLAGVVTPCVVAVRGRVASTAPLKCENVDAQAVLTETTVHSSYLKQGPTGEWIRDDCLVSFDQKNAPFDLVDSSTPQPLRVVDSQSADSLHLPIVYDAFVPASNVLSPHNVLTQSVDFFRGLKLIGTRTREGALRVGTPVTAVGEVVASEGGGRAIQRPASGGPFHITTLELSELIARLGVASKGFRNFAIVSGAIGGVLVAFRALHHLRMKHLERVVRKRAAAARAGAPRLGPAGGGDESAEEGACVACMNAPRDTVYRACGHMVLCAPCAARCPTCPVCRSKGGVLRVFKP